jgi:hypothetical protein
VAPALDFHPKSEVVLRYFPPGIEVEPVGLGADWRHEVKVVFNLRGRE